jgi:tRNA1Val (adenine37-N6)-methyltransferase
MSNTYFQFKQFRIEQDKCAMKVCTDSCILGAYTDVNNVKQILDMGTGTGLLSLMLAQRSQALIDTVEIDKEAFEQAKNNILNSPWKDRINIYYQSIQKFSENIPMKYDLIISNPPFFSNHLKSPKQNKNIALHNEALSFKELAGAVSKLLLPSGLFFVLLPAYEFHIFREEASVYNLQVTKILNIKDKPGSPLLRVIAVFSFSESSIKEQELIIKNEEGNYSNDFKELLKDYYLYF